MAKVYFHTLLLSAIGEVGHGARQRRRSPRRLTAWVPQAPASQETAYGRSEAETIRQPRDRLKGQPQERQHSAAARRDAGPTAPGEGCCRLRHGMEARRAETPLRLRALARQPGPAGGRQTKAPRQTRELRSARPARLSRVSFSLVSFVVFISIMCYAVFQRKGVCHAALS